MGLSDRLRDSDYKEKSIAFYRHQTSYFQSLEKTSRNEMLSGFPMYIWYYDVPKKG